MEKRLSWEQKWEQTRSKGKWHYILRQAFLWTLFMAIALAGLEILQEQVINNNAFSVENLLTRFLLSLLIFPAPGIYIGYSNWKKHETHYQKWLEQQKQNHQQA